MMRGESGGERCGDLSLWREEEGERFQNLKCEEGELFITLYITEKIKKVTRGERLELLCERESNRGQNERRRPLQ